MTQCVMDAAALTQVISGYDPRDPSSIELPSPNFLGKLHRGIKGCKIAWSRDWGVIPEVDSRVIDQVERSVKRFSEAGAIIEAPNITLPDEKAWDVFLASNELSLHRGSRLLEFTPEQHALLTPPTQAMLERVKHRPKLSQQQIIRIMENRRDLQTWINSHFSHYDLICTPTLGLTAPLVPEQDWQQPYSNDYYARHLSTCYTYIANVLGLPAASVPCGFIDGLPVGMQIIGPRFADTRVLRAAQVFSQIQPWINHHPQMAL